MLKSSHVLTSLRSWSSSISLMKRFSVFTDFSFLRHRNFLKLVPYCMFGGSSSLISLMERFFCIFWTRSQSDFWRNPTILKVLSVTSTNNNTIDQMTLFWLRMLLNSFVFILLLKPVVPSNQIWLINSCWPLQFKLPVPRVTRHLKILKSFPESAVRLLGRMILSPLEILVIMF